MLSHFSDPPRVFVPTARVGFLLSQSCSSPSLLYISPIHSSSPTTNCFILLRPTFFTLDQRFWLFSRPAHQTRSLCSSIPPLHSLIHRHLGASGNQLFLLLRISWILISTASIESIFFEELALKRKKNEY